MRPPQDLSSMSFMSSPRSQQQDSDLPHGEMRVIPGSSHQVFDNPIEPPKEPKSRMTSRQRRALSSVSATPLDRRIWLTTRAAADYLGTSLGGLRNRVYRGQLKPYKPFGYLGRSYFKRTDLDRIMGST